MNRAMLWLVVAAGAVLALLAAGMSIAWRTQRARDDAAERAMRVESEARLAASEAGIHAKESASSVQRETLEIPAPARAAVAPNSSAEDAAALQALAERVARLEEEVRQLRTRADGRPTVESLDTVASIEAELRALLPGDEHRTRRIALLERFLERFPDDPRAASVLDRLIAEHLADRPDMALASLDRFEARVARDPFERDKVRANVLIQNGRHDEGRGYYERIARAASHAPTAADAEFWIAYSYMEQADYDAAQSRFELLIARYESQPSPALASLIAGAKLQLEQIERYRERR